MWLPDTNVWIAYLKAREFGRIPAEFQRAGTPIGPYDLQIAAIALSHGFTLVTQNIDEFRRVRGLRYAGRLWVVGGLCESVGVDQGGVEFAL
ncbi:PIN domain-containing protein [Rhabdochromatium marinum]|uniref:PIN domain-containing protein n=1 Tax=Rhabdochromatium marinum TaxID=48729 RepID=UPI0019075C1D|nr:PIN domain-containing protein [Rhabdochromatium marinum]